MVARVLLRTLLVCNFVCFHEVSNDNGSRARDTSSAVCKEEGKKEEEKQKKKHKESRKSEGHAN